MTRSRLAWGLAVVDVAVFIIVASLVDPEPDYGAVALYVVGIAAFVGVGALLVSRVPANPIGVLLLAAGTVPVASAVIGTYADLGAIQTPPWPAIELARRAADASFVYPIVIAMVGVPLVFPDGHLPSPRFRWIVAITIVNQVGWTLGGVFGVTGPLLEGTVLVSTLVAFGGAPAAVIVRFRRGDLVQRQQIKWLAAVVCLTAVVIPVAFLANEAAPALSAILINIEIATLFALPIVIGIAILRYRLYEIDRIISRTVGYSLVTGILATVFVAIILVLQDGLSLVTQGDTVAVAISTLAVFVLFQPVRRRVQRAVDRRFDRARFDAERTSAAFAERLRGEMDIDAVTTDLRDTVETAIKPAELGLWLRESGR